MGWRLLLSATWYMPGWHETISVMAFSKRILGEGESVVLRLREHPKILIRPVLLLIILGAASGAGIGFLPNDWQPWGAYAIVAIALLLIIPLVIVPWLRWYTTTIAITDRRIITRTGIINRKGHDLPLRRINNVTYDRDLVDRLFGCGTLTMETAAGQPLELHDIPDVERVHVVITDLLFRGGPDADPAGE